MWTNSVTGRAAAIPNWRLAQLDATCLPIAVSGNPIEYSINRNAAGWVVELVHDNGVWKDWINAAIVTNTDVAMVTLKPSVPVAKVSQWQIDTNGNPADVDFTHLAEGDLALTTTDDCGLNMCGDLFHQSIRIFEFKILHPPKV